MMERDWKPFANIAQCENGMFVLYGRSGYALGVRDGNQIRCSMPLNSQWSWYYQPPKAPEIPEDIFVTFIDDEKSEATENAG